MNGKPSAFRSEITVEGVDMTVGEFERMARRAVMTAPLMARISQLLFEQQKARVESQPWEPLKESTLKRKAAQGENTGIFRDEWRPIKGTTTRVGNKLWLALTLDGATGQVKRFTRTTATFGVDSKGNRQLFYARFAQNNHGTKRKILAISSEDALAISVEVAKYIYPAPGEAHGHPLFSSGSSTR
jgi:hypothetical protein